MYRWIHKKFSNNNFIIYLYKYGYKVGFLQWCDYEDGILINFLNVFEKYRRQGIGTLFLHRVAEIALSKKKLFVYLDNVTNPENDLYQKLGFFYERPNDNAMKSRASSLKWHCFKYIRQRKNKIK